MTKAEKKKGTLVCCEEMLMELGGTVFLDSIQWPHLEDSITGPSLNNCPFCGAEMPFEEQEEA